MTPVLYQATLSVGSPVRGNERPDVLLVEVHPLLPQVDVPGIEPGFGSGGREHIPPPFTGTDHALAERR
jgi:hypothetical protein